MARRQSGKPDRGIGARILSALGERDRTWLAREAGISTSTLHDYLNGAVPSAERAAAIAKALAVDLAYLITGETTAPAAADERVELPFYDLNDEAWMRSGRKPSWSTSIMVPRSQIAWAPSRAALWVAIPPEDFRDPVVRAGQPVIFRDVDGRLPAGMCLFYSLRTRQRLLRYVSYRGQQAMLTYPNMEPIAFAQDGKLRPVGSVVGALTTGGVASINASTP